jgi:hypothetical protein
MRKSIAAAGLGMLLLVLLLLLGPLAMVTCWHLNGRVLNTTLPFSARTSISSLTLTGSRMVQLWIKCDLLQQPGYADAFGAILLYVFMT